MRRPHALPQPLDSAPFSVTSAREAGVAPSRLRASDLEAPFWGTRISSELASTDSAPLARAYATRMKPGNLFSHTTAAALWGIPIPASYGTRPVIHVATTPGSPMPRGNGIRGHRLQLRDDELGTSEGLRLTSPARTWCDLSTVLGLEDLVAAGDFLLWRRRTDRLESSALVDAMNNFSGRRGRPLLELALPLLSDRADSPPESVFRVRFHRAGLPRMAANYRIYDAHGQFVAQPDIAFPDYRVCFDYEGEHHFSSSYQWSKDLGRVRRIEDARWSHIRGARTDLRLPDDVISTIKRRLVLNGWRG